MARKTKEEAQETRRNILAAALDVFYVKGVRQTSLEDIAEAAGVTRGAVYWHFKNKTEISTELHTQIHMPLMGRLLEEQRSAQDPLQQLEDFCVDLLLESRNDPFKMKFFTVFFLKCDYSGDMEKLLTLQNSQREESISVTETIFRNALEQQKLPVTSDIRLMAESFYYFVSGIFQESLRDPGILKRKGHARELIHFFLSMLRHAQPA